MNRWTVAVTLAVVLAAVGHAQATVTLGPYTFEDHAFPDAATFVSGGPPTLSFPTTGDINSDLLLAAGPDPTKYIFGTPVTFMLDFLDSQILNAPGADLVLFELGTADAAGMKVRVDPGGGFTTEKWYLLTSTGYSAGGYSLNAAAIDLDDFGLAPGTLIERIQLNNASLSGGGTTISSSIAAVGALNTGVIPEPSTLIIWSLLGTLGIAVGWRRRRRAA